MCTSCIPWCGQVLEGYSEAYEAELRSMVGRGPALFEDLARSICPSVYGAEPVKKAILLMLLGGVHKTTKEVRRGGAGEAYLHAAGRQHRQCWTRRRSCMLAAGCDACALKQFSCDRSTAQLCLHCRLRASNALACCEASPQVRQGSPGGCGGNVWRAGHQAAR
jgi:hypothetical protein